VKTERLEALTAGSIDLGHTGDSPPLFAQAGNIPFVYFAASLLPGKFGHLGKARAADSTAGQSTGASHWFHQRNKRATHWLTVSQKRRRSLVEEVTQRGYSLASIGVEFSSTAVHER